jgi:hypothetical protein
MHAFIPTAATPNTTIHLIRHHRESVDTCYLSGQVMANVMHKHEALAGRSSFVIR